MRLELPRRNTKAYILYLNKGVFFFSYETCIAAQLSTGKELRRANTWGPTTGRHFNELGCKDFPIVSDELFYAVVRRF